MKTLPNVIHGDEIYERLTPPRRVAVWDELVDLYEGNSIMWFCCDEARSYNFKVLPSEVKTILIELTKDWEYKDHFGVYLA